MFDTELVVQNVTIGTPPVDALLEAGLSPHLELGIISGIALPFAHPQTGEPIQVEVGKYRFRFSRQQALDIFGAALEAAEALPEEFTPSGKVVVASSMSEVEQAARNIKRVSGR